MCHDEDGGCRVTFDQEVPPDRHVFSPEAGEACHYFPGHCGCIDRHIEAQMAKSTYEIRVAGTVPLDLLENFRQIDTIEAAGTILHAVEMDDAGLWGLIDALRNAGIDLIEIRREVTPAEY
jgi:hypothetical protein